MCTIAFTSHGEMSKICKQMLSFLFFCRYLNLTLACSEYALENAIFDGYKKHIRPVKNQSTTTHVYVSTVIDIVSISGQDETLELITYTSLRWTDEYLKWNKSDFDDCNMINTLASNIWVPDYTIMNMLEVIDTGIDNILYALITSDGTVYLNIPHHIIVRCPMDITDFPFDTQTCSLNFVSWMYTSDFISIHKDLKRTGEIVMQNSSEFETVSFIGEEFINPYENVQSKLTYTLVLKRRPEYYVFVLLLPTFLLTTLCIIGIFTPNSSGGERNEKMTLGLTTLLSMAVILNIVADAMPKSDRGLPLLGYYVLYEIGVCALSTIISTILICIHERANRKHRNPPVIIRWIASIPSSLGYLRSMKKSDKKAEIPTGLDKAAMLKGNGMDENVILATNNSDVNSNASVLRNEIAASLQQIISKLDEYLKILHEDEEREDIWASALHHTDLFFLVVFLCGNCVLTGIMLL